VLVRAIRSSAEGLLATTIWPTTQRRDEVKGIIHSKKELEPDRQRITIGTVDVIIDKDTAVMADPIQKYARGYLQKKGWMASVETGELVDLSGPVPWITYPAQMVLQKIVKANFKVFEFGAGYSSLWWGNRVSEVVSVDHNIEWGEWLRARARTANQIYIVEMDRPVNERFRPPGNFDVHC